MIDATHERMAEVYHSDGGAWSRRDMPRTSVVFLNAEEGLSPEEQSEAAKREADQALSAYWSALEGTIDPDKVNRAANNALTVTSKSHNKWLNTSIQTTASWHGSISSMRFGPSVQKHDVLHESGCPKG